MTAPVVESVDIADHEFAKACQCTLDNNEPCSREAAWLVWVRHNANCLEISVFACDPCKAWGEAWWLRNLDYNCVCGFPRGPLLSDCYRYIRL